MRARRVIHTINLINESDLAEQSDYDLWIDGDQPDLGGQIDRLRHKRSDGALRLLWLALQAAGYGDPLL